MRGPKTHRADQKLNRGERREPKPDHRASANEENESQKQEEVREEHPTRTTQAGYKSVHGNRR
jgi:hypothetical protein